MFKSLIALLPLLALSTVHAAPVTGTDIPASSSSENHIAKRDVSVVRNCNVPGQIAITFDDGPFQYDNDLINTLGNNKATFFVNGNNYGCIYDYADDL